MSQSPQAVTELSPGMREALRLLQAGDTVGAEETALRNAIDTRSRHGAGSHADAIAHNELGSVLMNVGQLDRAIAAMRESVSGPVPTTESALRDRLTFLMNLGQALIFAKRFEEAEEALHKGLEGRAGFYGREHAGFAFGLEPLAEVTARLGKPDIALEMIDEVVRNFWRNGHPRVAGALAIRAEILKSAGKLTPPFAGLEKLPAQVIEELGKTAVTRVARTEDLKISRQVLADLTPILVERLGESHRATINNLIAISNIERKLGDEGDPNIRQSAFERLIGIFDAQGRPRDALQATLGLALAFGDAGDNEKAVASYQEAVRRVGLLNDAKETSQVLRNFGLLLVELKRNPEAEARLREAVTEAEKSRDTEMLGRALIALGIFLQHESRLSEAGELLKRALPMLDPAHPDAITCRSHLGAIEIGGSCGCGDTARAIAEAFREYVMSRVPGGLLKQLDVTLKDADFSIGVRLEREASQDEVQHLNRVIEHALQEFRRKMGTGS